MDEKEKSVLEWCGRGYTATIKASGGKRLNIELPQNYSLHHQERRPDGVLVLSFQASCHALPDDHQREAVPEDDAVLPVDRQCVKLKVANNFKVNFPRSSPEAPGPD